MDLIVHGPLLRDMFKLIHYATRTVGKVDHVTDRMRSMGEVYVFTGVFHSVLNGRWRSPT